MDFTEKIPFLQHHLHLWHKMYFENFTAKKIYWSVYTIVWTLQLMLIDYDFFFLISVESFPFAIYSFQMFQIVLNLFTNYWLTKLKYKMSLKVWFLPLLQFYGWNINSSGEIRNQILLLVNFFWPVAWRYVINRGKK